MMARRKGKGGSLGFAAVVILAFVIWDRWRAGDWWNITAAAMLILAAAGGWWLFGHSTRCGYTTYRGKPCRMQAPGELRGCEDYHKGLKFQALLNHFGIRHPRQMIQRAWMGVDARSPAVAEPAQGRLERPNYDTVMLIATIVSALAAVVMPLIQMTFD